MAEKNKLYFGDNLKILREYVPDASVDLIYLDPPFNSNASYNVLFKEKSGEESAAQITAFEDIRQLTDSRAKRRRPCREKPSSPAPADPEHPRFGVRAPVCAGSEGTRQWRSPFKG